MSNKIRGVQGEDGYWRKAKGIGYQRGVDLTKELTDTGNIAVPAILKYSAEKHGNQPCMATRSIILRKFEEVNGKKLEKLELGEYSWSTYQEVYEKTVKVTQGIAHLGLKSKTKVVIFAETRAEWYICACLLYTSPSPRDKRQSRMPSSA